MMESIKFISSLLGVLLLALVSGPANPLITPVYASSPATLIPAAWQSIQAQRETGTLFPLTVDPNLYVQQKIKPPDTASGGNNFGPAVAVSGTTAVIGASNDGSGSVYVFEYSGGSWLQQAKLAAADGDSSDYFGDSVAISGDTVVVGAYWDENPNGIYAGSVYVFEKGSGWSDGHANQVAKLDPADGDSYDYFGYTVAISGDKVVVGAYRDEDPNGIYAGSVYVFEKGSGWSDGHANQVAKLDPADGDSYNYFGSVVAVSGDTVVVGAYGDEDNGSYAGSAYVFEKGSGWSDGHANQVAKLDPADGDSNDNFGGAVAISGDTVVVGVFGDEDPNGDYAGSVYVFEKGSGWSDGHANQVAKLDPADGDSYDYFGYAVAISGDTVVVGANRDEDPNGDYAGSVYVFEKGSGWSDGHANQVAKLDPADGDSYDYLGYAVAISGDTVVVGAHGDERNSDTNALGSAYVFEKGNGWNDGHANQVVKLLPDAGQPDAFKDYFGFTVAISGDTMVVGACEDAVNGSYAGSVYIFEVNGGSWIQAAKLDPADGDNGDFFGYAVAISGDTVVVGANRDEDPNGDYAGSVYVFEKGSGWSDGHANQVAKLDPADGDSGDNFGGAVAISGDTVVVGVPGDEGPNNSFPGSVYVFEKNSGWSDGHANQVAKLAPADGDDYFGGSVAISGDTVVAGTYWNEDPTGSGAGWAYVFEKGSGWSDGQANQVAKLDPDDGDSDDHFGRAVAISGDTVVVGANQDEDPNGGDAGSAYVFAKGNGWSDGHANQVAKLDPADGDSNDNFGAAVSISGDTVVVGANQDENPNGSYAGSAYVFEKGSGWGDGDANQVAKLNPDDGDSYDSFGFAVSVSGDIVVVGAHEDEDAALHAGSAYIFTPVARNIVYLPLIVKN